MDTIAQDVRYGLRMLLRTPGFTIVAVLTLALGIGANTAVFSLTYAVMLRSLPVQEPDRLALITFSKPGRQYGLSVPIVDDVNRRQHVFDGMLMWHNEQLILNDNGRVRPVHGAFASGNAFDVLGVRAYRGRTLTPSDDHDGGGAQGWVAVVSYPFWKAQLHGDPQVLGRKLQIENTAFTIIGVAPPHFDGVETGERADIIVPLAFYNVLNGKPQPTWMTFSVLARLKPGVSLQQARADVETFAPAIVKNNDLNYLLTRGFWAGCTITVSEGRLGRSTLRANLQEPLYVLEALVGLVLLIGCANVAGLLSARMVARRHELAVRSALGASRGRLLRQLAIETLLLCAAGCGLAIIAAEWATPFLLSALLGRTTPDANIDVRPDAAVLAFTCAVALLSALLVALFPALRSARVDVVRDLSAGARQHSGGNTKFEAWIVSGQVAFASLLLVAAGLFAGTVYRLLRVDPGFQTQGVLMMPTDLHLRPEKGAQLNEFYERILDRLRNMPGVENASAASMPMLGGWSASAYYASVLPNGAIKADNALYFNSVGANYFATIGSRILAGRDFSSFDRDLHHRTCMLNRSAAEYFFPQGNAVGSSVLNYSQRTLGDPCEIIGVVEDMKFTSLRAEKPRTIYWTFMEDARPGQRDSMYLLVRSNKPTAAAASMQQVMSEMAPQTPLMEPVSMDEQLRDSIGRERAMATLAAAFGALALLLTAVGLYGTLSYQVSRRTREIAIRIAVGADAGRVLRLFVQRALMLTAAGLATGIGASLLSARFMRALLYGIQPNDPAPLVIACVVLLLVALSASYLPARRATRVEPMEALRYE